MEDKWKYQYHLFLQCNATANGKKEAERCGFATQAFEQGCPAIVTAVLMAGSGDRNAVHEYMADVCSKPKLKGWRAGRCQILASTLLASMSADGLKNQEDIETSSLCQTFWTRFTAEEDIAIRTVEDERRVKENASTDAPVEDTRHQHLNASNATQANAFQVRAGARPNSTMAGKANASVAKSTSKTAVNK